MDLAGPDIIRHATPPRVAASVRLPGHATFNHSISGNTMNVMKNPELRRAIAVRPYTIREDITDA